MKELEYPFDGEYLLKKKRKLKKELENKDKNLKINIAILGGSTTDLVKQMIELFLLNIGISPSFYETEYNKYYEEALFPSDELIEFCPDIIYIHTTYRNIENLPRLHETTVEIEKKLDLELDKYTSMWNNLASTFSCPIIQNNFEFPLYRPLGNTEASDSHGMINYITNLNLKIYNHVEKTENLYINDINYLSAQYGLQEWADPHYWYMYKYAVNISAIPMLAYNLSNIIKSIFGKNKKVLVLDLDNTLWGGVIGDEGVENIVLGEETPLGQAYLDFQSYIKNIKDLGIVLTVSSKNDYDNAVEGLRHIDSKLSPDDFVMIKANWMPKNDNILDMSEELALNIDSFVFIDDNPAERELVEKQLPGISVPHIDVVENYASTIDRAGFFEVTKITAEDTKRTQMYQSNTKRKELQSSFANYNEYLESLDMIATIGLFEDVYIERIAQLTNKSNQFNLTTKRYTNDEISVIADKDNYLTQYGRLSDRFGDNGLVSIAIGKIQEDTVSVELWLMSCRVLKRNMEHAMMDAFVERAKMKGINKIIGHYYPTKKNSMVKNFYQDMGFEKINEDEEGNTDWLLVIDKYSKLQNIIEVEGSNE